MELVERETQLAALGEHLDAAETGHGRLVLVGGEAGVGKTSFVRAFSEEHAHDSRVVRAACDGLFTPQPLGPLFELADQLGFDVDGSRHEVFASTLDALRPGPTVVILEDVHWADEATLDLLRFLGRRLDGTATLLIATYRDDELAARHPLRVVLGDVDGERRISLPPLSEQGVGALAHGSDLDPHELHRLTGGNPFFVTEVLAADGTGVPQSVRDAVLARAGRLSPPARSVLDAAAVAGAHVQLNLLEDVLREPPRALEECLEVGVLQTAGNEVAFRHELARRAVEEAIDPLRRAALHARALAVLRPTTSDSALLAHHAEAAGDAMAVLEHAQDAARKAAALGPTERRRRNTPARSALPTPSRPKRSPSCSSAAPTSATSPTRSTTRSRPARRTRPLPRPRRPAQARRHAARDLAPRRTSPRRSRTPGQRHSRRSRCSSAFRPGASSSWLTRIWRIWRRSTCASTPRWRGESGRSSSGPMWTRGTS